MEILPEIEKLFRSDKIDNIICGLKLSKHKLIRYLCVTEYEQRKKNIILDEDSNDKYYKIISDLSNKFDVSRGVIKSWVYNFR
jgi:hypothetical protein